jgi:hypothetical protein
MPTSTTTVLPIMPSSASNFSVGEQ